MENAKNFQVWKKSGIFSISQGNLEKMITVGGKVREFENFPIEFDC